jgi:hypothetical protein
MANLNLLERPRFHGPFMVQQCSEQLRRLQRVDGREVVEINWLSGIPARWW